MSARGELQRARHRTQLAPRSPDAAGGVYCILPVKGVCVPAVEPATCQIDADCAEGEVCDLGGNCPEGMFCVMPAKPG